MGAEESVASWFCSAAHRSFARWLAEEIDICDQDSFSRCLVRALKVETLQGLVSVQINVLEGTGRTLLLVREFIEGAVLACLSRLL